MRYHVLATDYDGTLASDGRVAPATLEALDRLRATGRKLILVTGRELDELLAIFPEAGRFDWIVAENGGLLYCPASREEKLLGAAPPPAFLDKVRAAKVTPLSIGRLIVATHTPEEIKLLKIIRDAGLEMQVIFNKGSVMILPAGINKATGLKAALGVLGLSAHEVAGVGDAENDHAFLEISECAVAVANALPALKDHADLVTKGRAGAGVTELIEAMIESDLGEVAGRLTRHLLLLGHDDDKNEVRQPPYGANVLIAGPSGSGKSTAATAFLERLTEKRYQYCIIDPEGDYENLPGAVTLGNAQRAPAVDEILQVLAKPAQNVVVNLVGARLADRPAFFLGLLPRLQEMRAHVGRPHWLIVDEAHHLLPMAWQPTPSLLAKESNRIVFITVHPDQVSPAVLESVGTVIAVGDDPAGTLERFCQAIHVETPPRFRGTLEAGAVVLWRRQEKGAPCRVTLLPTRTERRRHKRKYAEGELPPERSFYFRGPDEKLNIRAQNLMLFLQIADGVDDGTWLHHLRQGDYSRWLRDKIGDEAAAVEVEAVERQKGTTATDSRRQVREAVERHYTLPAKDEKPAARST